MPPRASKHDPFRTFKFRVRLDNRTVAGVSKVTALSRTVTANEVKEGGDLLAPRQHPGPVTYEDVSLEWGLTNDREFESWANSVTRLHTDPGVDNFKRTVFIDVYDLDGNPSDRGSKPVVTYKLHRCWVSVYRPLPDLDAGSGGIGIQSITLKHEGWERISSNNNT